MAIGRAGGEAGKAAGGPGLRGEEAAGVGGWIMPEEAKFLGAGGAVGGDALLEEVVGILPGAGIAVALGQSQTNL